MLSDLTQQEKRVLAAMAQGLGNQGIADLLTIEKTTVEITSTRFTANWLSARSLNATVALMQYCAS